MSKSFLKIALLSVIFTTTNFVFCQTKWHKEPLSSTLLEKAKFRTIEYKSTDYIATGYVYKNQFIDGQNITFLSKQTQDTIISGRYYVVANLAYIDGVWKRNTENGVTRSYGIFQVKNADNEITLTIKPKEGKPLQIETKNIFYYQGFHNNYPAVLEKQNEENYSLTINYFDMAGKTRILTVKRELIEKYGWFAIDNFIYFTPYITIKYRNGDIFSGFTENTRIENNMIGYKLKEGVWTYSEGNYKKRELIKLPDGNYKFNAVYSEHMIDNNFAQMEIIVNKTFVDKYGYWGEADFMFNIPEVKYTYKNGNIFTGKQVSTINNRNESSTSINTKLTLGKLQYVTGEVFEGDLSGQWICGIPISGKIQFTDGSHENGNWLEKYKVLDVLPDSSINWKNKSEKYPDLSSAKTMTEKHSLAIRLHEECQQKIREQEEKTKWNNVPVNNEFGSLQKCYVNSPGYNSNGKFITAHMELIIYPPFYGENATPMVRFIINDFLIGTAIKCNIAIQTPDERIFRFNEVNLFNQKNIYNITTTASAQLENKNASEIVSILRNFDEIKISISATVTSTYGNEEWNNIWTVGTKTFIEAYKETSNCCLKQ